jgi:peptidoglycan/LPS O-acetylase OafA/YrhL
MTALSNTTTPPIDDAGVTPGRMPVVGLLRSVLLLESLLTLALAVFLSLLASGLREFLGGVSGEAAETTVRFGAAAAFVFAVAAAIASRGARRRRSWSWTTAAVLQLLLALGTGIAIVAATWHPAMLVGLVLPGIGMLLLSMPRVRAELGQD